MSKIYSLIYICSTIVISLICIFLCIFLYILTRNPSKANVIAKIWGKALVITALTKVNMEEHFDISIFNENYVLMSNHQSAFDIFLLYGYLPFDFTFLSKKEVFKIPLFGIAMKVVGAIAVDRENPASLKKTIKDMENYIKGGRSLLIFPEGTRSKDGKLLPFKKGGFLLAKKSKIKILPVTIIGSSDVLKRGSFLINPGKKVKIVLDKPIEVEGKNLNALMDEVKKIMQKNLRNSL